MTVIDNTHSERGLEDAEGLKEVRDNPVFRLTPNEIDAYIDKELVVLDVKTRDFLKMLTKAVRYRLI